jgi:hypothetical protein
VDVKAILSEAAKAVDEANIPEPLRQAAFEKAVDLLAASSGASAAIPLQQSGYASPLQHPGQQQPIVDDGTLMSKVGAKLKIGRETLGEVLDERDGKFDVIVPPGMLATGKAPGMKQLALIVAAARQGAELDDFTDVDHIRHFATEFNKYDSANFATDLRDLQDELRFRKDGRKLSVKLTRVGWERATALIRQLGGEESA